MSPDGSYRSAGQAQGDEELALDRPFPLALVPSALLAGYAKEWPTGLDAVAHGHVT